MYCESQIRSSQVADNHCVYIDRIVWDLSFSVVIACILWVAFSSSRLDWVDHIIDPAGWQG